MINVLLLLYAPDWVYISRFLVIWVSKLLLDINSWVALLEIQVLDRSLCCRKYLSGVIMLKLLLLLLHHSLRLLLLLFLSLCSLEWLFSWRFIPYCGTLFADLESSLSSCALFGVEVSAAVRQLFSLPLQVWWPFWCV